MVIFTMSASRLKKYLQCAESYHQTYEMGVRGSATHLVFGTLMHSVFERWYQEDTDILKLYEEEWNKADIADPEFYTDGFDIIDNFLKMSNKDEHALIGLEMPFAINIQTGKSYDTDAVNWDIRDEVKAFLKTLEEEDAPIIFGFIDRLEYDMANDILRVVDYKTSRMPLSQQEADDDIQLSMYDLVASILFPEYTRVIQELQYVRLGVSVRTSRTDNQRKVFLQWLESIFYKIRNDTTHKATLNKFCSWCDAKAGCSAYLKHINGEAEELDVLGLNDEQLDEQLEKISIHLKILDGRKKEIEGIFKEKLKRSDNSPIKTKNGERFVTPNLRTSYDVESIVRLFPNEYGKLLSPNKTEIDKLAKGNDEVMRQLEDTSNKYYIQPTLRKKVRK